MKHNRGVVSEKEKIALKVTDLAKSCKSLEALADKLQKQGITPYYRYNKLTGVWIGNMKFRLTTLGVGKQHLKEMTQEQKRLDGMAKLRQRKSKDRGRER